MSACTHVPWPCLHLLKCRFADIGDVLSACSCTHLPLPFTSVDLLILDAQCLLVLLLVGEVIWHTDRHSDEQQTVDDEKEKEVMMMRMRRRRIMRRKIYYTDHPDYTYSLLYWTYKIYLNSILYCTSNYSKLWRRTVTVLVGSPIRD